MKNAMQLKSVIKKISKEKSVSAQILLQNYMLERFLERISCSKYKNNYILKGGFLIASMIGVDIRSTMDMDATIKGYPLNKETVIEMIDDIIRIQLEDKIFFERGIVQEIREKDEYIGYRVSLIGNYEKMAVPLKLDITTGDRITPREIEYTYKLMLGDRSINILAYNLATILAEKLETVIARGDQNTRLRDYYDIFVLTKLEGQNIEISTLQIALRETAKKRGTYDRMKEFNQVIEMVEFSNSMNQRWKNYSKDFSYAEDIRFEEICAEIKNILKQLNI